VELIYFTDRRTEKTDSQVKFRREKKMNHISKLTFGIFATIVAGIFLFGVTIFLRGQTGFTVSSENSNIKIKSQSSIPSAGRVAISGESKNNLLLKSLLTADNLHFEETAMLSPQVEKSQTLLVRLKNHDAANASDAVTVAPSAKTELSLKQVKTSDRGIARQRSLELSTTQILIVALNEKQQVLWWTLQTDPRILRLETADDAGRLSNPDLVYRNEADLLVSLPADETIKETRFYHPNWNGKDFSLELIGSLDIAGR
jgi:hypothetical protein